MDSLLKYSQLAKALDVSNASVSMAIKNGKLYPEEGQKRIDINHPLNKLWIEAREKEGKIFDINRIYKKNNDYKPLIQRDDEPEQAEEKSEPESKGKKSKKQVTIEDVRKIEVKKKAADLQKTLKETEKLELQIKKIEGELIPYDAIKTVFLYSVETFRNTYQQEVNSIANIFIERVGGDHKHFIELQKELSEKINEIQSLVKDNLLTGLKGIVSEYSEIRGRGERK